jgi:hypothetical protein
MAEGVGPVNRDIRISLYHLSSGFFMGNDEKLSQPLDANPERAHNI